MENVNPPGLEEARRRIAADVLELRALKLKFRALLHSLEEGYADLSEAIGVRMDALVIAQPKPEIP